MHPPWIPFSFLLILFAVTCTTSRDSDPKEDDNNSTISRPQRETYERERRLIPYMTYYITQSLTNPTTGSRQNVFLPISPRENIFHVGGLSKLPITNVQSVTPQQIEILPKPVIRLQSPSFLPPTIQGGQYKPKEDDGIYPQVYRVDPGLIRPQQLQTPVQPQQIQSETQPLQVIKINPLPIEQKYTTPQVIKVIPVIKKLPVDDRSISYQPYSTYYKEPTENSYQENKLYPQLNQGYRVVASTVRPEVSKYTIARIVYASTTPSPYGRSPKSEIHPLPQPIYYPTKDQNQDLVQTQNTEQFPRLRVPQEEKIRFVATVTPIPVTNDLDKTQEEPQKETIQDKQSLNNIFSLLKETNKLPQTLTPDNIDIGIKTLALILERLQKTRNYQHNPHTEISTPQPVKLKTTQDPRKVHSFPEKSGTSTPGRPGIDYPIYSSIPQTNFDCSSQRYKGFFGDPDTNCQVWHYCDLNGGQASFLCPNGTIFSQVALTCDWWFNVKCASTSQLYVLNERLYKYILPFSPSFPEDFSGPVVDTYLAAKFKEMESKSKNKALKAINSTTTTEIPEITTIETQTEEYQTPSSE